MKRRAVHTFRVFYSIAREKIKAIGRSPKWPSVRESHLKQHPLCSACGGESRLQVHHIVPVHVDPSKELDNSNLITLCMGSSECHLVIGHDGSWKRDNPNVVHDAADFLLKHK